MNLNKFLPLTETTYYILLALCEPLHGYGIILRVKSLSSGSVDIAPGTLYGALENLRKQNLIKLIAEDAEKRRKIYSLTDLGHQVIGMEYRRMENLVAISKPIIGGSFNSWESN
jgi:DNA-binding PadR family transcriptional regulator